MSCEGKIRTTHTVLSSPGRKRGRMTAQLHGKTAPTHRARAAPSSAPTRPGCVALG